MITFTQITSSEEIAALEDYFVLGLDTGGPDPAEDRIRTVGMLQVSELMIVNEASVEIAEEKAESGDGVSEAQIAGSLARLLFGSVLVGEPETARFLRALLERHDQKGEIRFIPLRKLASACFPELENQTYEELASSLSLMVPDAEPVLYEALMADAIFRQCRDVLGGEEHAEDALSAESTGSHISDPEGNTRPAGVKKRPSGRGRPTSAEKKKKKQRVSDKQLRKMADRIWTVSPWTLLLIGFLLLIAIAVTFPRGEDNTIDREKAPNSYLVLSWNETGKYGTQPREKDAPIEFRIPYGVYNVLNNNSIPVEITITDEAVLRELALKVRDPDAEEEDEDEDEETGISTTTIRPSTQKQIIIDENQHLSLSEDANELIFFYVSEVPEEIASDTTGQINAAQSVVYAYVKGTEVRFRSAPSLEGHIIDTLNNGQQVQVLGITGEWTHVSVQDQKGYIFSQYLQSEDEKTS